MKTTGRLPCWRGACFGLGTLAVLSSAASATQVTTIHDIDPLTDGSAFVGQFLYDGVSGFYGANARSGPNSNGTIVHLLPPDVGQTDWSLTVLWSFPGVTGDGLSPSGPLLQGQDGSLYGVTQGGGTNGAGTVYRLSPPPIGQTTWSETVLHSFGAEGDFADGPVQFDRKGRLVGTLSSGGLGGGGAVYLLTPPGPGQLDWAERTIGPFSIATGSRGFFPSGGVTTDGTEVLYGTTTNGGRHGTGVMYSLTPATSADKYWRQAVVHNFHRNNADDGGATSGPLQPEPDGSMLYVTGGTGGGGDRGLIVEFSPPAPGGRVWSETVVHDFNLDHSDGREPVGYLLRRKNGEIFGVTARGGPETDMGIVFKLAPPAVPGGTWTETILHNFHGGADGKFPRAGLAELPSGELIGTTTEGGAFRAGTIFMLKP